MKSELLGTKAFVTIADLGCFTRAADELNLIATRTDSPCEKTGRKPESDFV